MYQHKPLESNKYKCCNDRARLTKRIVRLSYRWPCCSKPWALATLLRFCLIYRWPKQKIMLLQIYITTWGKLLHLLLLLIMMGTFVASFVLVHAQGHTCILISQSHQSNATSLRLSELVHCIWQKWCIDYFRYVNTMYW